MEKIKSFLLDSGYNMRELDNVVYGDNEFLTILVAKKETKYLVRNAIRCYFDRWANSGVEFFVDTEEEVIQYFADKNKCIPDATKELVYAIVEEAVWDNDDANIAKMISGLHALLEESE